MLATFFSVTLKYVCLSPPYFSMSLDISFLQFIFVCLNLNIATSNLITLYTFFKSLCVSKCIPAQYKDKDIFGYNEKRNRLTEGRILRILPP